jgi:hypothetical protein
MTQEYNATATATETIFRFTTTGGGFLIDQIAEIEKSARRDLQSGKSLDRTTTNALASMNDACRAARVSVT